MIYQIKKLESDNILLARQVSFLFREVFGEANIKESDAADKGYIKNLLKKENFYIFAALCESKVVGGLTAYEFEMFMKKEKEIYLYDLAVSANYRRQGIAKALIEKLKDCATQRNVSTIFVEANKEDADAVKFYKSLNAGLEEVCHFNISIPK